MRPPSIKLNYILNTVYQMLAFAVPLVTAPYVSRVLGANGVGISSFTVAVMQFFALFAVLGTTTYGQRAIARCRDDMAMRSRTFWEVEILRLGSTTLCLIAWILFLLFSREYRFFYAILTLELAAYGFDLTWFYGGLEKFVHVVVRNLIIKATGVVLLFLFVKKPEDVWIYLLISSLSFLLGNFSMWATLRPFIRPPIPREWTFGTHLKESMAYFVPTIAASVYLYIDKIMLNRITGSVAENGYYEQASKIIKVGYTAIVSLNTVMSSRMSYLFAKNQTEEIKKRLARSLAFIFWMGFPLMLGLVVVAHNFVPWFFGRDFTPVEWLLVLGSPLILIMSMHNFLAAQYLVPSGQRVRSTKGIVAGAVVNVLLNLFLIPKYRAAGALVGTLGAEASIFVVYQYMSLDFLPLSVLFRTLVKPVVGAIVMFLSIWWLGQKTTGSISLTLAQVSMGGLVYVLVTLLLHEQMTCQILRAVLRTFSRYLFCPPSRKDSHV